MDIEQFLKNSLGKRISWEEFSEFMSESIAQNRTPMINLVDDPNSPRAIAMKEYIEAHQCLPENYEQIPKDEIVRKGKLLCKKKARINKKKKIIMLLAHHGSREALDALEKYNKNPDEKLSIWAEMAIDECKIFLDKKQID